MMGKRRWDEGSKQDNRFVAKGCRQSSTIAICKRCHQYGRKAIAIERRSYAERRITENPPIVSHQAADDHVQSIDDDIPFGIVCSGQGLEDFCLVVGSQWLQATASS